MMKITVEWEATLAKIISQGRPPSDKRTLKNRSSARYNGNRSVMDAHKCTFTVRENAKMWHGKGKHHCTSLPWHYYLQQSILVVTQHIFRHLLQSGKFVWNCMVLISRSAPLSVLSSHLLGTLHSQSTRVNNIPTGTSQNSHAIITCWHTVCISNG